MKTTVTRITERGQTSVPASIRRRLQLTMGARIVWEPVSDHECRIIVQKPGAAEGPLAVLGFARTFRAPRATAEWMKELREGDVD